MARLGAGDDLLLKYQDLKPEHLKATTAVMNPATIPGHRRGQLAWFWTMDICRESMENDWMQECW